MSEPQFFLANNGQQLQQGDVNDIGEIAGLMDDKVLGELFRLPNWDATGSVTKFILPDVKYDDPGDGNIKPHYSTTVYADGNADGGIQLRPFRAIIGSRSNADFATDRSDYRSSVFFAASPSPTPEKSVTFSANASGNPRWDLVYALVTPDTNSTNVTRKIKNPTTGVVTSASVSVFKITAVTTAIVVGTPSASPSLPTLPADGGGTYYIPICYVRIPNGFGASSVVLASSILNTMPVLPMTRNTGVGSVQVASSQHKVDGGALTTARVQSWGSTGTRPNYYMPPDMIGEETIWIAIDCTNVSSANWSHQDDGIIDDSRDWRNRLFYWIAGGGSSTFAWATLSTSGLAPQAVPAEYVATPSGMGQSVNADYNAGAGALVLDIGEFSFGWGSSDRLRLWVDGIDGSLRMKVSGQLPNVVLIRLTATSPYSNK